MHTHLNPMAALAMAAAALGAGCADAPETPLAPDGTPVTLTAEARALEGPFMLDAEVYDVAAAPDGSLLVVQNTPVDPPTAPASYGTTLVQEIRKGAVSDVLEIHTDGSPLHGVVPTGRGTYFVSSGGLDLAVGAGVWHVARGKATLAGDIHAFESTVDPDANEGPEWKLTACEAAPPFTAGPQSNPYHMARASGSSVYVADAAGNSLLHVSQGGGVDWVAVFTPPTADGTDSDDPADWMGLVGPCYVQPVPTSVAVAPDGGIYVGELTGVTPANIFSGEASSGLSRIWRIDPGARHVTCPSDDCQMAYSGLTSIIDMEFGPDGALYVVEYDAAGWFAAVVLGAGDGGTIRRCDADDCDEVIEDGLMLPGAIAFDKWGTLWLLESNIVAPMVRTVDLP